MKLLGFVAFTMVSGLSVPAFALQEKENPIGDAFGKTLRIFPTSELETKALLSLHSGNQVLVMASTATKDDYLALLVRKMPSILGEGRKREMVSAILANAILKLAAGESRDVGEALGRFRYPAILLEYAKARMFSKVAGTVAGLPEAKQYLEQGPFFGVYVRLPREKVDLRSVQLVSRPEAATFYAVAVARKAKEALAAKRLDEAGQMLLESLKFGNDTKELFVDLFACQLQAGAPAEAEKVSIYLVKRFGEKLNFDDALGLGLLAENAHAPDLRDFWYGRAETEVRGSLTMEMLLPEIED